MSSQSLLFLKQYAALSAADAFVSPQTKSNLVTAGVLSQLQALNMQASTANAIASHTYDRLGHIHAELANGFAGLQDTFSWGISRICWEMEQAREQYRETLDVLRQPLATQGLELRDRAEKAIRNKWWNDAVADLRGAIENNRYDFLAHIQLAQILFFEMDEPDEALDHFLIAAQYADTEGASEDQRHYAALSYAHAALLRRLSYQAQPEPSEATLNQALQAAKRAVELEPGLLAAWQELALEYCLLGKESEAILQICRAIRHDDKMALGIAWELQLNDYPPVGGFLHKWGTLTAQGVQACRSIAASFQALKDKHSAIFSEMASSGQTTAEDEDALLSLNDAITQCESGLREVAKAEERLQGALDEQLTLEQQLVRMGRLWEQYNAIMGWWRGVAVCCVVILICCLTLPLIVTLNPKASESSQWWAVLIASSVVILVLCLLLLAVPVRDDLLAKIREARRSIDRDQACKIPDLRVNWNSAFARASSWTVRAGVRSPGEYSYAAYKAEISKLHSGISAAKASLAAFQQDASQTKESSRRFLDQARSVLQNPAQFAKP